MILGTEKPYFHFLIDNDFNSFFNKNLFIHFNYHDYIYELKGLFFGRPNLDRVSIASYMEEDHTTIPFNIILVNKTSRIHVAKAAVKRVEKRMKRSD